MRLLLLAATLCAAMATPAAAQRNYNLDLLANVPFPGETGSDCWGYVDTASVEYAVMGTSVATYIYSLEDAQAPVQRARIPGANSPWRDIKSFGQYLYVVADRGTDGILVIDMSGAPTTITHEFYRPTVTVGGAATLLERAHNLYITREGYLVLAGSNIHGGTPLFFDLNVDPEAPPFVGASRPEYAHDVFAERGRLYSSDIYAGEMTIHDYTNPAAITALGSAQTTNNFTHNAWPRSDDAYAYTTDEVTGAFVDAFNVADPTAIRRVDRFRPDESFESGSIPHNTHVRGDWLATSWYRDGVIITDALRPHNLVQVGQYDTYPQGQGSGFDGCWGTYPFLPSGRLIASDINSGLYVFETNYERGCYFEGTVIDSVTRERLGSVLVDFDGRVAQRTITDAAGDFATGIYDEGTYAVEFSREGYLPKTVPATMERGEVNFQIIELAPIKVNAFTIRAVTPLGVTIPDPVVDVSFRERVGTDNRYDILIGKWGYRTRMLQDTGFAEGTPVQLVVELEPGYADEFVLDLGWETTSDASSGNWERGAPQATVFNGVTAQLGTDVAGDLGGLAYVTGLEAGGSAGANDVDNGVVQLRSPAFTLEGLSNAAIRFQYHFFVGGGSSTPDDTLVVRLTNGSQSIELLRTATATTGWTEFESAPIGGRIAFTDAMQLVVETSDLAVAGHLVEAMFDDFEVLASSAPTVTVSANSGCAPFTVTFTGVGEDLVFLLEGASTTRVVGSTATVTYASPGSYGVRVIAGPAGARDTFLLGDVIQVGTAPAAAFTSDPAGLTVAFASQSTGANSVVYDFGDGNTSTDPNPTHTYAAGGTYTVTHVAISTCGRDTVTRSITVMTSSVREFAEATGITVLGNPVDRSLRLALAGTATLEVRLSDALGRVVLSQKLAGAGTYELPTAHLPSGVYFLSSPASGKGGVPVQVSH